MVQYDHKSFHTKMSTLKIGNNCSLCHKIPFSIIIKGGGGRGLSRLDLTVGRFFFLLFGKMSSGWETVEIN